MTGIPPHRDPQTPAEWEIAKAMTLAQRLFEQIQEHMPELPPTAISVGFINAGTQIGCRHSDPVTVAEYLKGTANIIAPLN